MAEKLRRGDRVEWDEYRVQVTPWEIDKFLPVL